LSGVIADEYLPGFFSISTEGWKYILLNEKYRMSLMDNQKIPFSAKIVAEKGGQSALKELQAQLSQVKLSIDTIRNKKNDIDSFALRISRDDGTTFPVQIQSGVTRKGSEMVFANKLIDAHVTKDMFLAAGFGKEGMDGEAVWNHLVEESCLTSEGFVLNTFKAKKSEDQIRMYEKVFEKSRIMKNTVTREKVFSILREQAKPRLTEVERKAIAAFNDVDAAGGIEDVLKNPAIRATEDTLQGGIDFDLSNAEMDIQSDGNEIKFNIDPAMIQRGDFSGLVPVIRSITPVTSIPNFLHAQAEAPELVGSSV
jgi:hypothetical protein